jgi:MFS family permease
MAVSAPESSSTAQVGVLRPLRHQLFRALWLATVFSNIGTWMHDVSAAWLMTTLSPTPMLVALVTTAGSFPMFLLALPAGALADILDRRRLLLVTQVWMLASAALLGLLTIAGWTTPGLLLALTAVLASGAALNMPAWQAITPELVPHNEVPSAVSLGGVSFNLARAIGPALGGLLLAAVGPGPVFLLRAFSFIGIIYVLLGWHRMSKEPVFPRERMLSAIRAGIRYARHAPMLQTVLLRTFVFMIGASALWALLPLFASEHLRSGALEYGMLMGAIGLGALAGAALLPVFRRTFSLDTTMNLMMLAFALAVAGCAVTVEFTLLLGLMAVVGVGWMVIMSTFNVGAQLTVPAWVRARALSLYLVMFMAGMALGSVLWGWIAGAAGVPVTLAISGGSIVVGILLTNRYPLQEIPEASVTPSLHWPLPDALRDTHPDAGPVLVTIDYEIDSVRADEFLQRIHALATIRKRDGAMEWGIYHEATHPERFVETYLVESWAEHLRQHARFTYGDKDVEDSVHALHVGREPPRVRHLLYGWRKEPVTHERR